MTAARLIQKAASEGVRVRLESDNKLKACGPDAARARWLPILREHKSELIAELTLRPPTGETFRPPRPQDRKTARPQDGGGLGEVRPLGVASATLYDPARLQREADRRNAAAARNYLTDRFCRCGRLAPFAWLGDDGREVWRCVECAPARGRA